MKKYYFVVILFFCLVNAGYAQDKIITKNNDTIDCKITKVSHGTIFFDVITKGVTSAGRLPLNAIQNYLKGANSAEYFQNNARTESLQRLRIGISGGCGTLLSSTKNAEKDMTDLGFEPGKAKSYYKDMKTGRYANSDLTWLFSEKYGIGVKYKFFETSAKTVGLIDAFGDNNLYYLTFAEHIYVNYFAGAFHYQEYFGREKSFLLNTGISLGLTRYRDEIKYLDYYLMTGKSFGMDVNLGIEYSLNNHISLRADLSDFTSTITKMTFTDGTTSNTVKLEKKDFENLSRLDCSVGIILYLGKK